MRLMIKSTNWYKSIICLFIGHFWGMFGVDGRGMDKPAFRRKRCVRCDAVRADY